MKEEKAVKQKQIKMPMNKDSLIIAIIVGIVLALTIGIVVYYFVYANKETVATYDGGEVTRGEYEIYYKQFASWLSYYGYNRDKISEYVGNKIILDKIIYEKAIKEGYKINEAKKAEIDKIFTSKEDMEAITAKGMDPEKLKTLYYNDSIISDYIDKMKSKVTTEEVKASLIKTEGATTDFNIYNTSHILFQFKDKMTDAEKATLLAKANGVLAKALKGSSFAELAKVNSDDSSATSGGVVPVNNNNSTYPEYIATVLKLKPGQINSKIIETAAGYHIIKLDTIEKNGRLTDESEIGYYVDAKLNELQKASNYKFKTERIKEISAKMAAELGIADPDTTPVTQ